MREFNRIIHAQPSVFRINSFLAKNFAVVESGLYGLIRFILEPCNFTLNMFQDFVFTNFKTRAAMSMQLLTFKTPIEYNKAKPVAECLRYF